jgi:hypothetical protein
VHRVILELQHGTVQYDCNYSKFAERNGFEVYHLSLLYLDNVKFNFTDNVLFLVPEKTCIWQCFWFPVRA